MGLLDQAVESATVGKANADAAAINRTRERGNSFAADLTEDFGIEGIEWLDNVEVTRYVKKYRDFGGAIWHPSHSRVDRFQVDDVVLGVIQGSSTTRAGSDFAIWHTCPTCGEKRMYRLQHVSTYGKAPKDIAKHKNELIHAIGRVAIANEQCTYCDAQPCMSCGKPR